MTFDTTPLERDCVLLNCSRPAIAPLQGKVHCAKHDPNPPAPAPIPDVAEAATRPTETASAPTPPDMSTMEPVWDGTQFVLRPRRDGTVQVAREDLEELLETLSTTITLVGKWLT